MVKSKLNDEYKSSQINAIPTNIATGSINSAELAFGADKRESAYQTTIKYQEKIHTVQAVRTKSEINLIGDEIKFNNGSLSGDASINSTILLNAKIRIKTICE